MMLRASWRHAAPCLLLLTASCGPAGPLIIAGISAAKSGYDLAKEVSQVVDPVIEKACAVYESRKATALARIALGAARPAAGPRVMAMVRMADAACVAPPQGGSPLETAMWVVGVAGQVEAEARP
jgi:hypothetical protein